MNPIIRVDNLSKQYSLGTSDAAYSTLRESIAETVRAPLKRLSKHNGNRTAKRIWALNDVSFQVAPGEVIGIIGRNGAGKSTLLKILSRITEPTTGRVQLFGRVGSLLEVGTGFHPELTGRENIFLNGAILGMGRAEIKNKFDEIVAFAELETFLDTPVKRYSSGMYMRLAFAVASHLEPEILIIDEVLAVGDVAFQKKCLGKIGDVAHDGRTVVFVSHNMMAIQSLCRRALWLDRGRIVDDGMAGQVTSNYLSKASRGNTLREEVWSDIHTAAGNDSVRLHRIQITPESGVASAPLTTSTPFSIAVEYWNLVQDAKLHITLHLFTENEIIAFTTGSGSGDREWSGRPMPTGLFRSVCQVPAQLLNVGRHRFKVLIVKDSSSVLYQHESEMTFEILDLDARELSQYGHEPGVVKPALKWTTERIGAV